MKKIAFIVLAFLLCLGFAGCDGSNFPANTTASTTPPPQTTVPQTEHPYAHLIEKCDGYIKNFDKVLKEKAPRDPGFQLFSVKKDTEWGRVLVDYTSKDTSPYGGWLSFTFDLEGEVLESVSWLGKAMLKDKRLDEPFITCLVLSFDESLDFYNVMSFILNMENRALENPPMYNDKAKYNDDFEFNVKLYSMTICSFWLYFTPGE